jgi:hypothetical protein
VHAHALRAFANAGRARPVSVERDWPAWVEEGLVTLRPAFEVYRATDAGWGLLVEGPTFVRDLGLLDGAPLPSATNARWMEAVSRATRELDLSRGARAKDEDLRAFHAGVSMRRQGATPAELNLLAVAIGLESPPMNLDAGRRRWAERAKRWELARAEREVLALVAAADLLLDRHGLTVGDVWRERLGVSDRLESGQGPEGP